MVIAIATAANERAKMLKIENIRRLLLSNAFTTVEVINVCEDGSVHLRQGISSGDATLFEGEIHALCAGDAMEVLSLKDFAERIEVRFAPSND